MSVTVIGELGRYPVDHEDFIREETTIGELGYFTLDNRSRYGLLLEDHESHIAPISVCNRDVVIYEPCDPTKLTFHNYRLFCNGSVPSYIEIRSEDKGIEATRVGIFKGDSETIRRALFVRYIMENCGLPEEFIDFYGGLVKQLTNSLVEDPLKCVDFFEDLERRFGAVPADTRLTGNDSYPFMIGFDFDWELTEEMVDCVESYLGPKENGYYKTENNRASPIVDVPEKGSVKFWNVHLSDKEIFEELKKRVRPAPMPDRTAVHCTFNFSM